MCTSCVEGADVGVVALGDLAAALEPPQPAALTKSPPPIPAAFPNDAPPSPPHMPAAAAPEAATVEESQRTWGCTNACSSLPADGEGTAAGPCAAAGQFSAMPIQADVEVRVASGAYWWLELCLKPL